MEILVCPIIRQVVVGESLLIEAARVTIPSGTQPDFITVNFEHTYQNVPAVFVLNDVTNIDPADVRVRNITTSGFQIAQIEPDGSDGMTPEVTVDYIAIETGLHQLPGGSTIEVGTITTDAFVKHSSVSGSSRKEAISLASSYINPSIIAEIQATNNPIDSPVFYTAAVDDVTGNGFTLALDRAEVNVGSVSNAETISYLAVESGTLASFQSLQDKTITFESINFSTTTGEGYGNCSSTSLNGTYSNDPLVVSGKTNRAGNNGGWVRRCSIDSTSVGLLVDEDVSNDLEIRHIVETVSAIVLSEPFTAEISQP